MRIEPKVVRAQPRVGDTAPLAGTDGVTISTNATKALEPPPLLPAQVGALTNATVSTTLGAVQAERPKAPWWQKSVDISNAALAHGPDPAAVVRAILDAPELKGARLSVTVLDAAGKALVDVDSAVPRNPCSNAKVITAAWALSTMGPAHRLKTTLLLAPDGALVVRGGFDPTITKESIAEMAAALRKQGITHVPRIVLDTSPLQGTNVPASFDTYKEQDWEYLSRPEPFSVDKNLLHLTVTPGDGPDAPAKVSCDSSAFSIVSKATTVASKSEFQLGCDESDAAGVLKRDANGKPVLEVWGTIAADYAKGKTLTMKSPAPLEQSHAALVDTFAAAGITVGGAGLVEGSAPAGSRVVHEHKSKTLATILETSLATSNAFDHEMLALATAQFEAEKRQSDGPVGVSLEDAARQLTAYLHSLGVEGTLVNGSGIGNDSRVPSSAIAQIFQRARTEPRLSSIIDSVSTPGGTGTLKTRQIDTVAEGVFHGKTGTGDDAVALSGVAGPFTMSVIVDDMHAKRDDVRAVLDAMAIALSTLAR